MPIDFKKFEDRVDPQFWTKSNRAPKMQNRFRVVIPGLSLDDARNEKDENVGGDSFADKQSVGLLGADAWYVKSCDKPGMDLPDDEQNQNLTGFQRARANPRVTAATMRPITMVLVDPYYPNVTRKIARLFRRGGLNDKRARDVIKPGGQPADFAKSFLDSIGDVQIYQLDEKGNDIERWTLYDAYPDQVDFGKFDHSSDSLVEITLTWYYTAFTVEFPNIGKEQDFKYFRDSELIRDQAKNLETGAISQTIANNQCAEKYTRAVAAADKNGYEAPTRAAFIKATRSCRQNNVGVDSLPLLVNESDDELTGQE